MQNVWAFLNSSFFVASITLAVGLIAYWLYTKKNKDLKKDSANILLLEIQNAERLLKVARERMKNDNILVDNAYVMPTESWNKYKYMFVRDLDRDEWDTVSAFYDSCHLFDEAVAHKSAAFKESAAAIRANLHRITADYVKTFSIEDGDKEEIIKEIDSFQNDYLELRSDLTLYIPNKPVSDAKALLDNWNGILSQSSVGMKLKKLAGFKNVG